MKKKLLASLGGILALVGICFYVWSRGSASTTVTKTPQDVKGITTEGTKQFQELGIGFLYPGRFAAKPSQVKSTQTLLLQRLYTAVDGSVQNVLYADQMAVTVRSTNDTLNESADVALRKRDNSYVQLSSKDEQLLFEKDGTLYEIGVFSQHDGTYVSVVLSAAPNKKQQLKNELMVIAASLVIQ